MYCANGEVSLIPFQDHPQVAQYCCCFFVLLNWHSVRYAYHLTISFFTFKVFHEFWEGQNNKAKTFKKYSCQL